jgi:hypothetical protein
MLTMTLAYIVITILAVCSGYDMVWLEKVLSPSHRQRMCCALKSTSEGKRWRRGGECMDASWNYTTNKNDHAVCMWLLWEWTAFACGQGCIHSTDSVKSFLKRKKTEQNGDKHTWICPIETLICNCWTNYYTLDQLDAGKSARRFWMCHCYLDFYIFSRPVHLRCKL